METRITCPPEPCLSKRLSELVDFMPKEIVILLVDFSNVGIVTGSSISKLLKLRKVLERRNGQIVLCNVTPQTKGIFAITELEKVFKFSDH